MVKNYEARHSLLFCIPYFIGGGLIYLYKDNIMQIVNKHRITACLGCVISTALYYVIPDKVGAADIIFIKTLIVYIMWVSLAVSSDIGIMSNKFTRFISGISMEMYLSHMVAFRIVEKLGFLKRVGDTNIAYLVTFVIVVGIVIVGIQLYKAVERIIVRRINT